MQGANAALFKPSQETPKVRFDDLTLSPKAKIGAGNAHPASNRGTNYFKLPAKYVS